MSLKEKKLLLQNQQSQRLLYRKVEHGDYQAWMEFCEYPDSFKYLTFIQSNDAKERCDAWFKRIFYRYENNLGGMNALINKETNELVGMCGLLVQEIDGAEELEIGYSLIKRFYGKGYASEAAIKCKNYAFENNFAESIISIIDTENEKSIQVAKNNRMQWEKVSIYNNEKMNIFRVRKSASESKI